MQSYLCFVNSSNELEDEANEALTLYLIQQALDNSLLHQVVVPTTSNEAWSILEIKYIERGSNVEGSYVCEARLAQKEIEIASVCEAEHEEDSESKYAQPYVEDDTLVNLVIHIDDGIDLVNLVKDFVDDNEYETAITVVNTLKAFDEKIQFIEEWIAKPKPVEDCIQPIIVEK